MPVVAGKRSSLSDVAQAAGVDVSTVSLVLNRKPLARRLRAETRERIEACARELDYRPSRAARALKTGKTGMIGIVVGDISSIFYAEVTAAALRTANLHGSQLLVAATDWSIDKERLALKSLLDAGVDGIIFLPGSFLCHTDQVATIRREKIPVVTYDYKVPGASAVFCDYTPGMPVVDKIPTSDPQRRIGAVAPQPGDDPVIGIEFEPVVFTEIGGVITLGQADGVEEPGRAVLPDMRRSQLKISVEVFILPDIPDHSGRFTVVSARLIQEFRLFHIKI